MAGILLFGGSFDPIHHGHLIVSRFAAEQLGVERVVLIPSPSPPHKQRTILAPVADRLDLCRLAVAGDPLFEVSDWESQQSGPSYTLRTIEHFRATLPAEMRLFWLIGMDSLVELPTWYRIGELVKTCTLVTVGRPGFEWPNQEALLQFISGEHLRELEAHTLISPLIEISATRIRERVRTGQSIRYLVPEAVRQAIAARGLYRDN